MNKYRAGFYRLFLYALLVAMIYAMSGRKYIAGCMFIIFVYNEILFTLFERKKES